MRLLWLSHFVPYPPRGGNLQRSHHLLREMSKRHEVHLVTLNQRALLPTPEALRGAIEALASITASINVFEIPSDRSRWRWIRLVASSFLSSTSYEVAWLRQPRMAQALRSMADRTAFDLAHVDTIGLWPYVEAERSCRVLNHHNVESQMMTRRGEREPRRGRRIYFNREAAKIRRLEEAVCPRASMNLVVSPLDADRLAEIVPAADVRVVENGVDTGYFRPERLRSRPKSLIFAASWDWYPNAEAARFLFSQIWPKLRDTDPTFTITIVGRNPPPDLVAAGRDGRVTVTGPVDDVRPYFAAAEVYVCPIQDGGGTRLKVLDALAMGIPMVATRLAVEGIGVIEDHHFLRAETADDFVRQIVRLSADPDLRNRLAANGRALVEGRYSWAVIGDQLDGAYTQARTKFLGSSA